MEKFDVLICGAGPAGCTAALAMGKPGLKVAMLDKAVFPRDKICGDAIAPYVPKVLATIDPAYAAAFEKFERREPVNICRIVAPNEKVLDLKFAATGFISARVSFDHFLFELAAALPNLSIFQGTTITDVVVNKGDVMITTDTGISFTAKLVIGCDGAHSIINKKLTDAKMDPRHHSGAVRAYYKNVTGIPAKTFELHFLKDIIPGYFWIFPLENGQANVGLGMLSNRISGDKINLRKEMLRIIETNHYIKGRFAHAEMIGDIKGFGLPLGSRKVQISGNHFMLCGDAASLIDPATGEGIGQAMVSGRYAGWQAIKCFEKNDFSAPFMKAYDKAVYDKLWKGNRNRYFLQKLIDYFPGSLNMTASLAARSKRFHQFVEKYFA